MSRVNDRTAAIDWFFDGEVGTSSEAICRAFLGREAKRDWGNLPSDADDLARCRLFVERLSEDGQSEALRLVSEKHPAWRPLVRDWQKVCSLMDKECPLWRKGGSRWGDETHKTLSRLRVEGYRIADPDAEITTRPDGTLSSYRGSGHSVWTEARGE